MKTILIVDDEPDNIKAFAEILLWEHYAVLTASNGVECLKIAHEQSPDLFLLDVNMPMMGGYETIQQLRLMKRYKYTPIVFLSGQATTPMAIDSGFTLGSNEYWTKPISAEELIVRVRAVFRIADAEKQVRQLQQSFYSMVVHDLRNPVGAILGMSEFLLEDEELSKEDRIQMVSDINSSSKHLLEIVKDLLELSQFESGEYHLTLKHIPLNTIVAAALEKITVVRNQKHIEIDVELGNVPELFVDEEYFAEVLDNLLDNALRYTPANGKITVKAHHDVAKSPNGFGSISIEIIDSGCGISSEELPSLFDKSRITNVKFRKANSRTGLGLVVCREIMEAHDGTISVESKVREGSKFTLTLPVR